MSRHNRNDQDSPVLPRAKAGDVRHVDGDTPRLMLTAAMQSAIEEKPQFTQENRLWVFRLCLSIHPHLGRSRCINKL